jgi:hypothetical protein
MGVTMDESYDALLLYDTENLLDGLGEAQNLGCLLVVKGLIFIALGLLDILFLWLACSATEGSFIRDVWVKLFSGLSIFLSVPLFVKLWARYKWKFLLAGAVASIASGGSVFFLKGVSRSFALELSIGILLLVGFDFWIRGYTENIDQRMGKIREKLKANPSLQGTK